MGMLITLLGTNININIPRPLGTFEDDVSFPELGDVSMMLVSWRVVEPKSMFCGGDWTPQSSSENITIHSWGLKSLRTISR